MRFYLPPPPLTDLITSYYFVDTAAPLSDRLHPEWGNMRFALSGEWTHRTAGREVQGPLKAYLFGPTDRAATFAATPGRMIGVGLMPLGWSRLVGLDASRFANRACDLTETMTEAAALWQDLSGAPDDAASVSLLNAAFAARAAANPVADPLVTSAQRAIMAESAGDVAHLADQLGLSERTLNRLCRRVFGFAPKRLLRRQRFLRTLNRIRDQLDQPHANVIDDGYCDYAHFCREFRTFMGMTPSAYYRLPREIMRRAATERQRVVGAPMQGLHPVTA